MANKIHVVLVFWQFCGAWFHVEKEVENAKWESRVVVMPRCLCGFWELLLLCLDTFVNQQNTIFFQVRKLLLVLPFEISGCVVIHDQAHKAILGELGKCSKASKPREELALQSGSFQVIAFYLCSLIPFLCHEDTKMKGKTFWKSVKTWIYCLHCILVSLPFKAFSLKEWN